MEKEIYTNAEMDVVVFESNDIIATSGEDYTTPIIPGNGIDD